ncbi:TNT domain-containing protein [Roseinatronobacter alkalisoli]|uniref:TNT domain-containing protein n=1 Tax=Roseinatronobacter alkalisoli TaxID=3028235 RepID=UPI003B672502
MAEFRNFSDSIRTGSCTVQKRTSCTVQDPADQNFVLCRTCVRSVYGGDTGGFMSPSGVPCEQRALPPENIGTYRNFEVIRPIEGASVSRVAPAYGQPGGGWQIQLPAPIGRYIGTHLREIAP